MNCNTDANLCKVFVNPHKETKSVVNYYHTSSRIPYVVVKYIIKWPIVLNNKEACSLLINTKPSWKLVPKLFNVSGKNWALLFSLFIMILKHAFSYVKNKKDVTRSYIIICIINVKSALKAYISKNILSLPSSYNIYMFETTFNERLTIKEYEVNN